MNLSGRSYLIFGGICLIGIMGQWMGGEWQYVWRIPAAALLLAALIERRWTQRLDLIIHRSHDRHANLGRLFHYLLIFENNEKARLSIEFLDQIPQQVDADNKIFQLTLNPTERHEQTMSVTASKLGEVKWGILYIRILGPLGLAWWSRRVETGGSFKVIPDYLQAQEIRTHSQQQGDLNRRVSGAGQELLGLREYRPEDPLRIIDWKATARSGKTTVRIFTEEQHLEIVILVDIGRLSSIQADTLSRLHHYINITARLSEKAIINGDRVSVIFYSDQPVASVLGIKDIPSLSRLRAQLAVIRPQTTDSNPLPAAVLARQRVRHRGLMVFLTDLDESDAMGQLVKASSYLSPKHVPMIASILDQDVEQLRDQEAKHWIDPYQSMAASENLLSEQRTSLHIQQLGGVIVRDKPGKLDTALVQRYEQLRERHRI